MRLLSICSKKIKLDSIISKVVYPKTGTTITTALASAKNRSTGSAHLFLSDSPGTVKLISYGKKTSMYQKGIDQVQITKLQDGSKNHQFFHKGKELYSMSYGPGFAGESPQILRGPDGYFGNFDTSGEIFKPRKGLLRDSLWALIGSIEKIK